MTRRARRQRSAGGGGKLRLVVVLLVLVIVAAGVGHTLVRQYLRSDGFRAFLSDEVSDAIRLEGEFAPFRWDGLAVESSGFRAAGEGVIRELQLDQLRTEVGLNGFWRKVWEVKGVQVRRLELSIDPRAARSTEEIMAEGQARLIEPENPAGQPKSRWLPSEVEIQSIDVGEIVLNATVDAGDFMLSGMALHAEPTSGGQAYELDLVGGVLELPCELVPRLEIEEVALRYQDGRVFMNLAKARAMGQARIDATGEFDSIQKSYAVQGQVSGVKCAELLSEDWVQKVSGVLSTSYQMVSKGEGPEAKGQLVMKDGVLTALPLLDVLAAYTDTRRFRVLTLSEAHTDWRWKTGEWQLNNLVLASEGLLRLEGDLIVRGEALDGRFRLGIAPGTLASIPGAETHVFEPGKKGLLWAPLRITGTLDDPKQDLKQRLVQAAGTRLFTIVPDTGMKALKFSGRVLKEAPGNVLEEGFKVIEGGGNVIEGVGGLIQGLLGGEREKPREP